ncbi:MAG TPA: TRAP transporter large permease subunit [Burkholderiales bacterium]
MEWWATLLAIFGAVILLLALGIPVAFCFLLINIVGAELLQGGGRAFHQLVVNIYGSVTSFSLLPIPLFVLMGEILWHSNIATRALGALDKLLGRVPGRLSLLTVASGTVFAALSGSTMANTAMLGTMLLPEMRGRGYASDLSMGPIMGSGALAMLIPPSALAVIFAAVAKISIGKLLVALILPGLVLAALYTVYIVLRALRDPGLAPAYDVKRWSTREKLVALALYVAPLSIIVFLVVGVIFIGVATPTEAAALGCVGSFGLAALYRDLSWERVVKALRGTLFISVMMLTIMAAAIGFSQLLAYSGASRGLLEWITSFQVAPIVLVILMQLVVLVLGCFMEQIAIMLITLPIFMPILKAVGVDPIWFAVIMMLNLEVALMTPPFGLLLFVMKGAVPQAPITEVYRAAIPYVVIGIVNIGLVMLYPDLATGLTRLVR